MLDFEKAQRTSLTTQVEMNLKSALIIGALKPGARLITKELAEQLGTSITPVREALLRLVSFGALQATPAQAFLVPVVSQERYREINAIRKQLEGMAAATALTHLTTDKLGELQHLADEFQTRVRQGDVEPMLQANYLFRFRLYRYAEMPTLTALIEQLWIQIGPCFNFLHPQATDIFPDTKFYADLLMALEKKDEEATRQAMEIIIDHDTFILQRQYVY
ncbi:GntR family transcriptional regulator [Trabulsiella guamensis ATCC 49490]|uniref:GntR family transcriptional regulator n=1 Tax=Trabulsiella guamensis ATCC 49490 TaxID=1005994 RepID=A0A085AK20_9ENTR|nr:GntR family transcriptional regulator [Trabulsiella guamensis]KFC10565.1 GntR family transcriptional regulator [Trabulsiella guamensis ATCC 49490]